MSVWFVIFCVGRNSTTASPQTTTMWQTTTIKPMTRTPMTTQSPKTNTCVDIGWGGMSCQNAANNFARYNFTLKMLCLSSTWFESCCNLCKGICVNVINTIYSSGSQIGVTVPLAGHRGVSGCTSSVVFK